MYIEQARNLSDLFYQRVNLTPERIAYSQFDGASWQEMSWQQVAVEAGRWQTALIKEDLRPGDRVAICLKNSIEWVVYDQAALGMGLVLVPLFYNDRPDNMAWCMNDAGVHLMLLGDGSLWPDISSLAMGIKRCICVDNTPDHDKAIALKDWLPEAGQPFKQADSGADDLASIVYTSGTTGRPKGVMLTHENMLSNVLALSEACHEITDQDEFLSFLPLSHMFERTVGYYSCICKGAKTSFARSILELSEDMVNLRPTIMVCVPRIFERIYSKVQDGLSKSAFKRVLFNKAVAIGWRRYQGKASFVDNLLWPVLDHLVGKKLRNRLGGRIRLLLIGGAPMPSYLLETFIGLGFTFLHGYGLTETSPVICFNRVSNNDPFSVGMPLRDVEVRTEANGELLTRGPNVMKGYWNNPEATKDAVDEEGWLHTGDVVRIEDDERIFITGRVKEIIVMLNGEKVPPADAEAAILSDTVFQHAMIIGEGRSKLGLIAVADIEDEAEACKRANAQLKDFPGFTKISHIKLLPEPWTVENGCLTPKLSVKRHVIEKKYAAEIEEMFASEAACKG
ncbi:MAG: AMP-dependent synthetase/ligase [Gammaproteobacteria bacterium]|nr:MAG: AMP-dependent synthetase/ligase [Gammaproteobacteria bacterium]